MTNHDKSNEIAAAPRLLEMLSLRGKVVTADPMHCQRQVAQSATGGWRRAATTHWR